MNRKRIGMALGTFALIAAGQAAVAPAAHAAGTAAAALPSCPAASVTHSGVKVTVLVFNGCSTTKRFRIAWDESFDSQCYTLARGKHVTDSNTYTAFEGLKSC